MVFKFQENVAKINRLNYFCLDYVIYHFPDTFTLLFVLIYVCRLVCCLNFTVRRLILTLVLQFSCCLPDKTMDLLARDVQILSVCTSP